MTNAKIEKFISSQYLNVLGKNLPAIYKAVNQGIGNLETIIQACIDQLFLTTASGSYLIQLGEESGFVMPTNSGLDIRSYKVLVPIMVASPKQVRFTIDELVQAFYQKERTKPIVTSTVSGPYSLIDGDDLIIETENGIVSVSIVNGQVSDLSNVSAQEIAAVLNVSQDIYFAEAVTDRSTGLSSVKLISGTSGAGAFIRIAGGKLQNVLQFPNLINTQSSSVTTWNLTKTSIYTDVLKFQWDGVGTNPNIYLNKIGDVVTIRGLVDGAESFSVLNGSYELIDVGYDYFVIRNDLFDVTSATLIQGDDDAFIFTSSAKISIFDYDEYALTSETSQQTITLTVPAVPPLARRFLQGSAHIHGHAQNVLDFTRSSIKVEIGAGQDLPIGDNFFVIKSDHQRVDFTKKFFKTSVVNSDLVQPTYALNAADTDYQVLPYTVATSVSNSEQVIYGELDSNEFKLTFPNYRHGLQSAWGFTLAGYIGSANILASDINKEHGVYRVLDDNNILFRLYDTSGLQKKFTGVSFAAADVYRYAIAQADGSDFYIDFGSAANAIASGLTPGISFRFDTVTGTDVDAYLAGILRFNKYAVTSVSGAFVNFSTGLGIGPQGLIISGVPGVRSGLFGGTSGTYFFDKTSTFNSGRVMSGLQAIFIGYTAPSNPLFLGPYIYDPDGEETSLTVSKYIVKSNNSILKGESKNTIFVDDSMLDGEFPQTGKIVLDYGTSFVEGPINYFAFVKNTGGTTQILIDPAYKFTKTHEPGAQIQYIHASTAYIPSIDGEDYPPYVTGTSAARNTLFILAELLVASGIFVESNVILPDLRNDDSSIEPFE